MKMFSFFRFFDQIVPNVYKWPLRHWYLSLPFFLSSFFSSSFFFSLFQLVSSTHFALFQREAKDSEREERMREKEFSSLFSPHFPGNNLNIFQFLFTLESSSWMFGGEKFGRGEGRKWNERNWKRERRNTESEKERGSGGRKLHSHSDLVFDSRLIRLAPLFPSFCLLFLSFPHFLVFLSFLHFLVFLSLFPSFPSFGGKRKKIDTKVQALKAISLPTPSSSYLPTHFHPPFLVAFSSFFLLLSSFFLLLLSFFSLLSFFPLVPRLLGWIHVQSLRRRKKMKRQKERWAKVKRERERMRERER